MKKITIDRAKKLELSKLHFVHAISNSGGIKVQLSVTVDIANLKPIAKLALQVIRIPQ